MRKDLDAVKRREMLNFYCSLSLWMVNIIYFSLNFKIYQEQ